RKLARTSMTRTRMDSDGALVITLAEPDWAMSAPDLVAALTKAPPTAIRVDAKDAGAPTAEEAQVLAVLARHAQSVSIPFVLAGAAPSFHDGVAHLGLAAALPQEGDASP
ncbi:MAG: hypothetical protein AAF914_05095, partial [Pseudomonadota bacterium]